MRPFSIVAMEAEENAKLLYTLLREFNGYDYGSISGFFEVDTRWRCPCCHRNKREIARLDKNGNLMCALHWHHDHFSELAMDKLPVDRKHLGDDALTLRSLQDSFCRFPETLICCDCNVAEGSQAKPMVGAPKQFSFAPFEIATFVVVRPNVPHMVNQDRAKAAYASAVPSMKLMGKKLREITDPNSYRDGPEAVGHAAWRVMQHVRAQMKEAK